MARKLLDEDVKIIREIYAGGGLTLKKIANYYGVSESGISRIVNGNRRAVLFKDKPVKEKKPDGRRKISDELREQIKSEYSFGENGRGYESIAARYGVSASAIKNIVKKRKEENNV